MGMSLVGTEATACSLAVLNGNGNMIIARTMDWKTPDGDVVKNYQPIGADNKAVNSCKPTRLPDSDLTGEIAQGPGGKSPVLSFAWVDGGNDRVEKATVFTSPFNNPFQVRHLVATFAVQSPYDLVNATANYAPSEKLPNTILKTDDGVNCVVFPTKNPPSFVVVFGASAADATLTTLQEGMTFDAPYGLEWGPFNGYWCQVVNSVKIETTDIGQSGVIYSKTEALDTTFPYRVDAEGKPVEGTNGFHTCDSPSYLDCWRGGAASYTAVYSFEMWHMCKPQVEDSIYVPVCKFRWTLVWDVSRAANGAVPAGRSLSETVIATYGTDLAVVSTLFRYPNRQFLGRQSQTWLREDDVWRIVHAHVSEIPVESTPR